MEPVESNSEVKRGPFASTRWSLVIAAGDHAAPQAAMAMEQLCATYWQPLYLHVRRLGYPAEEAQDLTQAFFVNLLERNILASADPKRGRFRTFLLAAMKNLLANERDRQQAIKRGGNTRTFAMDFANAEDQFQFEQSTSHSPEQEFDRRWVIAVLEAALAVVMTKQCSLGKRTLFEALMPCLLADDDAPQHSQIAGRFGMTTAAVKKEVSRLRHQYAIAIREQVASTMPIDGDIEDENRELFRATKRTGS